MTIVDPRLRRVARAIGYRHAPHPLHDRDARTTGIYVWVVDRRQHRRTIIAAAVRVLDALDADAAATFTATIDDDGWDWDDHDTDVIGEWEEEYSDRIGIGIVEWAHLRGLPDPPERVHVTVRRAP